MPEVDLAAGGARASPSQVVAADPWLPRPARLLPSPRSWRRRERVTCRLEAPLRPAQRSGLPGAGIGSEPGAAPATGANLLIVEDEPTVRELLCAALRHAGFTVTAAGTGQEALARAPEVSPDLVLLEGAQGHGKARGPPRAGFPRGPRPRPHRPAHARGGRPARRTRSGSGADRHPHRPGRPRPTRLRPGPRRRSPPARANGPARRTLKDLMTAISTNSTASVLVRSATSTQNSPHRGDGPHVPVPLWREPPQGVMPLTPALGRASQCSRFRRFTRTS